MKKEYKSAFPVPNQIGNYGPGLSIRDYFAAQAMQALLSNAYAGLTSYGEIENLAYEAYLVADAMTKEQSK